MSKDTISVNMNVYDIPILVEQLEKANKEIKILKEEYVMLQNASDEVEKEKDREIERLNKEIKEYQEELEKADSITQSCIFEGKEEATKSYRECLNLLERLHSIIKEVREYINSIGWNTTIPNIQDNVWRILDKEE